MGYYYNMHLQKHFRQNILYLRNANSAKSVLTFLLSREIYLTSSDPILTHFLIVYVVYIRATYQLFMVYCIIMSPQLIKQNYPFTFVGIMLLHIQKFVESISVMIWNAVVKQLSNMKYNPTSEFSFNSTLYYKTSQG